MTVIINGTTGVTSVNGSAAAPSVTGTDTDTGIVYGTNTLSLATGGTAAVTIDSSQVFYFGTTSSVTPGGAPKRIQVVGANAPVDGGVGSQTMTLFSTDTSSPTDKGGALGIGGYSSFAGYPVAFAALGGRYEGSGNKGYMQFCTLDNGGTMAERARFNSTGAFVLAGGTTTADGIGITFPATQSGSSNANTLDDYEEGGFTMQIADNASGGNAYNISAAYIKIGRVVTISFSTYAMSTPTWTAGNAIHLRGLPFITYAESCAGQIMLNTTRGNVPINAWQPNGYTHFVLQGDIFGDYFVGSQMQSTVTTYATLTYYTLN